jgi:hypothetical protein
MKILPFGNTTYYSHFSSEQIKLKLAEKITPIDPTIKLASLGYYKKRAELSKKYPYEGVVEGNTFNINRIIGYRNSFLPMINGNIIQDGEGSKIEVKLKMHPFVLVFMVVWFISVIFICLAVIASLFFSNEFEPKSLLVFLFPIFGIALLYVGFTPEKKKIGTFLEQLFQATK